MKKTFIYGLFSDKDNIIRYVGKSDNPILRVKRHIYQRNNSNTHKNNWINKVLNDNNKICFKIIEEVDYTEWPVKEIYWIDKFENLVNTSKGGKGGRGIKYKLSYLECKEWVKDNLSYINTKEKWYSTLDTLPDNIPSNPRDVYKYRGWISWGDFLSTGNVQDNKLKKLYLNYEDAKAWIIDNVDIININSKIWLESNITYLIPNRPNRFYKNRGWISWGDFLSNNKIQNQKKVFLEYDKFLLYFVENKIQIKNCKDWSLFRKNSRPDYIHSVPDKFYKDKGWISWIDFFSKINI